MGSFRPRTTILFAADCLDRFERRQADLSEFETGMVYRLAEVHEDR
ncbi:MAG: hypothetical protein ACLVBJ_11295 [Pilosibacter sp.]